MATNVEREEITLPADWDVLDATNGFAFDIGCSVMKLAYIAKTDYIEPSKREKGSKGLLRLINFSREELDEAFEFIKKNVYIKRKSPDDTVSVYSSGMGGTQYADDFKKILNVKNYQLSEGDCFQQSMMYLLKNIPRGDVLHPIYKLAFKTIREETENMMKLMAKAKPFTNISADIKEDAIIIPQEQGSPNTDRPLAEDDIFPCGLAICGSGFGLMKLCADGSCTYLDASNRGGRTFLGLGSILSGAKDYVELMELCEKGVVRNVNMTTKRLKENTKTTDKANGEDMYKTIVDDDTMGDNTMFCFGLGIGKKISDFRREDLARAVLEMMICDVVQFVHGAALQHDLKHVFFAGGFVSHPFIRQLLTFRWLRRDVEQRPFMMFKGDYIPVHFLKAGQHLGAIGALFNHKYEWVLGNKIPDENNK